MNLLCALTAGETALVIMLPVIAAVIIAVVVILIMANRKSKSNKIDAPRTVTTNAVTPQKPKSAPVPQKIDEQPKPARTAPTEILLTPSATSEKENVDRLAAESQAEATETNEADETVETTEATENPQTEEAAYKPLKVRYNRSFTARLILAPDPLKDYYAELYNKLLSYAKVKNRVGWATSSFNFGRVKLAKLNVKGKTLYLYTALDPKDFVETKYKIFDVSEKKRYEKVPCMFKIRSERAQKRALELIDRLAEKIGLLPTKKPIEPLTAQAYPADTEQHLIERKLIKVKTTGGEVPPTEAKPEIKVLKSVSVTQAQQLMTSEAAATLVKTERIRHAAGRKYAVNIDVLSSNFDSGENVDIAALKAKRIVPKKETAIKILARGTLDKKLTIRADDFSADAVKMIALTGGQAIKLKQ